MADRRQEINSLTHCVQQYCELYRRSLRMDVLQEDDSLRRIFEDVLRYEFDIENLAFEGGGAKMASYVGVIKVR